MNAKEEKKCRHCEAVLKGRADKKYCNDFCRSAHNNTRKSTVDHFIRNTNNALIRNRRILESFLNGTSGTKKVARERLVHAGFQFKYLTHTHLNRKKRLLYFCYDFGYMPLENDHFLIVRRNDP